MKQFAAFLFLFGVLAQSPSVHGLPAQQYFGVDLYAITAPDGALNYSAGSAYGGRPMAGGQAIGEVDFGSQGVLWDLPGGVAVNLHPTSPAAYSYSSVQGTDGESQVGYAYLSSTGEQHALIWHGAADTAVDLHPSALTGIHDSIAIGVSGNQQVGRGSHESSNIHALLWNGSPESAVDLHPTLLDGILDSVATDTDGTQQVGFINRYIAGSVQSHAIVWNGTPESGADLHPAGYTVSIATGVSGGQQVGWGDNATGSHPLLWTGTAESAIDLSPANLSGIAGGAARATNGIRQVGNGFHMASGTERALLWAGSGDSAVDLHALLPPGFRSSTAYSIDADGTIWGLAVANDAQFTTHAVKWSPIVIPEPGAMALGLCGAIACVAMLRQSGTYSR